MSFEDDDSPFEQALRADLPTAAQQERMRQRFMVVAASAGSGLIAANAAASQTSLSGTLLAKLGALSWPVKLGLVAALATPVVALPLLRAPTRTVQAKAGGALTSRAFEAPHPPVSLPPAPVAVGVPPVPSSKESAASGVARAADQGASNAVTAVLPVQPASSASGPAVAAFEPVSEPAGNVAQTRAVAASTLAAETRLLDAAFAEIASGHRAAAAALIAQHEKRFPNGLLRQERERAQARLNANSNGE